MKFLVNYTEIVMYFLLCCFPGWNMENDGYYSTFLLYHHGEPTSAMWEKWSAQMSAFDAGICSETKVSVLSYFHTKAGVSITPFYDKVVVSKTYSPTIILNGGKHGSDIHNEGAKSVTEFRSESQMMHSIVGQRKDYRFDNNLIDNAPRLRSYRTSCAIEDGEIITEFFSK